MADNDPKHFRPAGETPENRNFNADEDPLVELARIVSEDGGFYSKADRTPPAQAASPEARDAFSADLEAELMQELEYSLRARQDAAPAAQTAAAFERPSPSAVPTRDGLSAAEEPGPADVSFDQATAADPYQDDPAELLRALQEQLGGFGHRVVAPAQAEEAVRTFSQFEPDQPSGSGWADDAQPDDAGAAGYAAAAAYPASYADPAPLEDPFAAADTDALSDNPFLTPEREAQAGSDYGTTPGAGEWDRSWAASADSADRATAEAAADEELDFGQPEPATDPVKAAPSWAAASTAGIGSAPRWLDRQSSRPVAANDDPLSGADQSVQAGRAAWSTSSTPEAGRKAASAGVDGPDWLTSGHDVRRDLRPTMTDFDAAPERGTPAHTGDFGPETSELPGVYAEDQPAKTWADQGFESGIDDFETREDAKVAPIPAAAARSRSAAHSAGPGGRRSRRNSFMLAGIVGAVVLGGAVAAYVQSTGDGADTPPPVIRAEQGEVKVEAANEPAEAEAGRVVYNPPASDVASPNEQLVDSAEEPREVARVVLPPPQAPAEEPLARPLEGVNAPAEPPAGESVPAQNSAVSPIGPRKVRTVVVRPDGTIVASSEAAPGTPADAAPQPEIAIAEPANTAAESDPLRANPVRTTSITSPIDAETADPGSLIAEEPGSEAAEAVTAAAEPIPDSAVAPDAGAALGVVGDAAGLPRPRPQTSPEPETQVALRETQPPEPLSPPAQARPAPAGAPIDLLAASPGEAARPQAEPSVQTAARSAPTEPAGGGFVVQLSSQRSEAAARSSAASLKRQFGSVLGPFEPRIQQANLGAKGTFYRVRIGPMATRAEAVRVCESLQAAGGSCFVGR